MPDHSGSLGHGTAALLRHLFGGAAPVFPVLLLLLGSIAFLEIDVPQMLAGRGGAAVAYFFIIVSALGSGGNGGLVGGAIWGAMRRLIGTAGAWILLVVIALALTLWLTETSLKKGIGWVIAAFGRLNPSKLKLPKVEIAMPEGYSSWREAFSLP